MRPEPYAMPKEQYEEQMKLVRKVSVGWSCTDCKSDIQVKDLN